MWFALLLPWAIFNLAARPLAFVLPLFATLRMGRSDNNHANRIEPRLPLCLAWFDTPDNSLLGDFGFQQQYPNPSYWSMVQWLRRNPACGFDWSPFAAAKIDPTDKPEIEGNPHVSDAPHGLEGRCMVRIGKYWNLVKVTRYGERCIKVNIGWELKTYAEDESRLTTQPVARYAASVRFPLFKVQA